MNCITNSHRQCYKTSRRCTRSTLDISSYSMPSDTSVNMDFFVLQQGRHGRTLCTLFINNRAKLHAHNCRRTCTHKHMHAHTHTHTHRTIRSGTYTTRFLKPHIMSKTCINNSKQYTLKEAMAMHTPNVSCESVMSVKSNCTLECTAGLKIAANNSLPVVKSAHIHFTQDARVW